MTRDELAQRLVVGLEGPILSGVETAWLSRYQPAGVILFARNCENWQQLARLCTQLRALVPQLAIMADHEGGPVSALARAVGRPPVAFGLGILDDIGLTARVHAETGRRLRAVGLTRVLAPVADVLSEPRNPVIGARAFGGDSELVSRHVAAAVSGLVGAGLQVCLKHWPGHGASRTDTHQQAATDHESLGPGPFVAGLGAGADAIMAGHLPTGDDSGLPATLHREFLAASRGRLAELAGAAPLVLADDVTMGGLRAAMARLGHAAADGQTAGMVDPGALKRGWLEALLAAGCDQLLVRGIPWQTLPLGESSPAPASTPVAADVGMDQEPYHTARRRCWERVPARFGGAGELLLWWDLTVGDRWQVAGGDLGAARERLLPVLLARFKEVHTEPDTGQQPRHIARLLVTSHRPLPLPLQPEPRLAASGVCLVMGHPSLAADLADYLGPGWQVGAVYDVAPDDLFVASGPPTNI